MPCQTKIGIGIRAGYRYLLRNYHTDTPPDQPITYFDVDILDYIPVGMEATIGARFMFTKHFGMYAEIGLAKSFFPNWVYHKFLSKKAAGIISLQPFVTYCCCPHRTSPQNREFELESSMAPALSSSK